MASNQWIVATYTHHEREPDKRCLLLPEEGILRTLCEKLSKLAVSATAATKQCPLPPPPPRAPRASATHHYYEFDI